MIVLICFATLVFTFFGGYVALALKSRLHLILGFSAGAVIGVTFFDLLPAAIELSGKFYSPRQIAEVTGVGFIIYCIIDWTVIFLNTLASRKNAGVSRGNVAALFLTMHSCLDGITIGLAFKISPRIGLLIALAVIIHDIADGINTTSVIIKGGGSTRTAITWLALNSIAPILGAVSTYFFQLSGATLGILLSLVSGFFIYLGASVIIPETRQPHPRLLTLLMTLIGILVIFITLQVAGDLS